MQGMFGKVKHAAGVMEGFVLLLDCLVVNVVAEDASMESTIKPAEFFWALGDATRYGIVGLLVKQGRLSVSQLMEALDKPQDTVSKHLRVLRELGVVEARQDDTVDARRQLYAIVEKYRVADGVLDFGFCLLRFG
jgi:DNA-binding transcriptional ArsR family regulator